MRRFLLCRCVILACVPFLGAAGATPTFGEPGYWAGDVSPADADPSADADTPPRMPRVGPVRPATVPVPRVEFAASQPSRAIGFARGEQARAALAQLPRRPPIQPAAPTPLVSRDKPFEPVTNRPTISPYLNLFREEDDAHGVPNYFAYVRPQLEQQETNRRQAYELDQLRRQVQAATLPVAGPQSGAAGIAGRSTPARFMDTAQFYSGWQR